MATFTMGNINGMTKRTDGDTLQIHQQLSPEEYQMQRQLNERADYERYASLNTPTYSGDPNRIAEENALAEMQRTGLARYYHPNSAAYYAAFQGIRDKYLQQEMAKKAAIENEGKQLYSNRMGAFDKLIQDQYGLQKEKVESAGLEGMRKAQTKLYEAQAEGGGVTPAQKKKEEASVKRYTLKYIDDTIRAYDKIAAEAKKNGTPVPPQIIQGTAMAWDAKQKILSGKLNPLDVEYYDINNLPDMNNPAARIQAPKAEGVKLTPQEPPKEKANGMKYKSKADALFAIKELSAADALNVMRANGITKDELREFLNPTKKQQTPRPVTGMPLTFS